MHNIVLYQNISDFKEKLNILRSDKELCASIARNGQELAEQRYTFTQLGKAVVSAVRPALRQQPELSFLQKFRNRLGF